MSESDSKSDAADGADSKSGVKTMVSVGLLNGLPLCLKPFRLHRDWLPCPELCLEDDSEKEKFSSPRALFFRDFIPKAILRFIVVDVCRQLAAFFRVTAWMVAWTWG
jgi:hypothetical protein